MRRIVIARRRLASDEEALAAIRAMELATGKPRLMDVAREAVLVIPLEPPPEPAI